MAPTQTQGPSGTSKRRNSDVYNPNQDLAEKRQLRQDYRELIGKTEEARKDLSNMKFEHLDGMLKDSNALYAKVKAPAEGVLDSRVLVGVGEMGRTMAQSLRANTATIDMDEFMNKIALYVGSGGAKMGASSTQHSSSRRRGGRRAKGEEEESDEDELDAADDWNWDKLGRLAIGFSRRAPTMDSLLGPLKADYKKRNVVKRVRVDRSDKIEKPEELNEKDIEKNENETTKVINDIFKLLESQGSKGANMFDFVVDPTSFGNTIENLFYVSFLVRDGVCAMIMPGDLENPDGTQPLLMACVAPEKTDYSEGLRRQQIVLEMDMTTWKGLIETFDITRSIIPQRKIVALRQQAEGKWYG